MSSLLAVDLGLKTGFALFGRDGRLCWYRSHNFGTTARLRRGVYGLLGSIEGLDWIILEGGGAIADIWEREAARRKISVRRVASETWRRQILYPREQRSGRKAKERAIEVARQVIEWSQAPGATALRHDTAEAILIGLWGLLEVGWLLELPPQIRR